MRSQGQKTNATGASHPGRTVSCISSPCLPASRRSGTDGTGPKALSGSANFAGTGRRTAIRKSPLCHPCVSQQPNPLQEQTVEEAAMPGQPSRTRARFRFPPAIHPRESPAAASVTARHLSASLRDLTYALNPLWDRLFRAATEKHFPLVKNLWTIGLSCGGLRKTRLIPSRVTESPPRSPPCRSPYSHPRDSPPADATPPDTFRTALPRSWWPARSTSSPESRPRE